MSWTYGYPSKSPFGFSRLLHPLVDGACPSQKTFSLPLAPSSPHHCITLPCTMYTGHLIGCAHFQSPQTAHQKQHCSHIKPPGRQCCSLVPDENPALAGGGYTALAGRLFTKTSTCPMGTNAACLATVSAPTHTAMSFPLSVANTAPPESPSPLRMCPRTCIQLRVSHHAMADRCQTPCHG